MGFVKVTFSVVGFAHLAKIRVLGVADAQKKTPVQGRTGALAGVSW
jgi:hypothetical protein